VAEPSAHPTTALPETGNEATLQPWSPFVTDSNQANSFAIVGGSFSLNGMRAVDVGDSTLSRCREVLSLLVFVSEDVVMITSVTEAQQRHRHRDLMQTSELPPGVIVAYAIEVTPSSAEKTIALLKDVRALQFELMAMTPRVLRDSFRGFTGVTEVIVPRVVFTSLTPTPTKVNEEQVAVPNDMWHLAVAVAVAVPAIFAAAAGVFFLFRRLYQKSKAKNNKYEAVSASETNILHREVEMYDVNPFEE
jgi:hypothetical protein